MQMGGLKICVRLAQILTLLLGLPKVAMPLSSQLRRVPHLKNLNLIASHPVGQQIVFVHHQLTRVPAATDPAEEGKPFELRRFVSAVVQQFATGRRVVDGDVIGDAAQGAERAPRPRQSHVRFAVLHSVGVPRAWMPWPGPWRSMQTQPLFLRPVRPVSWAQFSIWSLSSVGRRTLTWLSSRASSWPASSALQCNAV